MAKADLVPTDANLRHRYVDCPGLVTAGTAVEADINVRRHRETGRGPAEALAEERAHLHRLPIEPYTAALGETRKGHPDQTIRFGSVWDSTPPGHVDTAVWCRVSGDELVVVARTADGLGEIARHPVSTRGGRRSGPPTVPITPMGARAARRRRGRTPRRKPPSWRSAPRPNLAGGGSGPGGRPDPHPDGRRRDAGGGDRGGPSDGRARAGRRRRPLRRSRPVAMGDTRRAAAPPVVADEAYSVQPGTAVGAGLGR